MVAWDAAVVRKLVWLVAGVSVLASLYFVVVADSGSDGSLAWVAQNLSWSLLPAAYAVTAAMIVGRQPRNLIGWLLMISAVGYLSGVFVGLWVNGFEAAPESVTVGLLAALAFDNFSWVLLIFPIFHLLLVFPTGRLLSSRWRWAVLLETVMILVMVAFSMFTQPISPFSEAWSVRNPVGFIPASMLDTPFFTGWTAGLAVLTIAGVVSQVMRYRRAGHVEREQIKWLVFAVAIFGLFYIVAAVTESWASAGWLDFFLAVALINIGASIAIAILRYHLFDIDRIISRTVGYTLVIGVLGGIYFGIVTLATILLPTQDSLAVAAATLAAAALFNPLRKRIQAAIDRRFNRSGYQVQVVSDQFAAALRDPLTADQVASEWTRTIEHTLQPSAVGIWLRTPDQGDR
jgi:hypothetical protein